MSKHYTIVLDEKLAEQALLAAAAAGSDGLITALIDAGVDPSDFRALMQAAKNDRRSTVRLLLKYASDQPPENLLLLMRIAACAEKGEAIYLIEEVILERLKPARGKRKPASPKPS